MWKLIWYKYLKIKSIDKIKNTKKININKNIIIYKKINFRFININFYID